MQVPRLDAGYARLYVPAFAGERDKHAADPAYRPVTFFLRPMTEAACDLYDEFKSKFDPQTGTVSIEANPAVDARIFAAHVERIDNLAFADGEKIVDAAAFLAARNQMPRTFNALYKEILTAIRDLSTLSEGEIKN
ncbi:MAG TPA: hypothetical protein PKW95_05355 [bacterium]|nr:hypothetical protein [bacterium]